MNPDINDLFAKDPLSLTREDITAIITYFRGARAKFALGDTKAGSTKPKTPPKALKGVGNDLSDLLGEIKL